MAEIDRPVILHVEDNPSNRKVVQHILRTVDVSLIESNDGEAGLDTAARELPDLILLDMHLPGASGYEVVERLKADGRTQRIPVIAITSDAMADDEERARKAGCDDYVAKPYRPPQLLDAIRRHLTC
ncbi:MAG TPA: response regulator [Candidatus Latescibacteria bacterium]|jgi:two-component system cell cycle response regulator DivK|nr:response regulator [Gemmatimonadaceae bacterium]MDP6014728.1 response regulator [Candidatus Latescibacterota bacterium]HJP29794.1 response regulator [Candidatus Latescibacterota bacterium]|tara:strand:- start:678 stop:1058 length:381 start_codon:yes stop_codon:yes gene_type:complete